MNKYIFLDIDGPLNTDRDENKDPERYGHRFDNEAVGNLREIVEATGASIVISSSWRHMGIKRMREIWKDWKLPGKVIGCTPGGWGDERFNTRGEEIQAWLDENAKGPKSYVIFDDLGLDEALDIQYSHWIQVDPHCGITTDDADRAIRILNEKVSESYLFPREGVIPLEIEGNHKDYMLSEILLSHGYKLNGLAISLERQPGSGLVYQLFAWIWKDSLSGKYVQSAFYPSSHANDEKYIPEHTQLDDVRLRYYFDKSGAVSNILWVALYKDGKIVYSLASDASITAESK